MSPGLDLLVSLCDLDFPTPPPPPKSAPEPNAEEDDQQGGEQSLRGKEDGEAARGKSSKGVSSAPGASGMDQATALDKDAEGQPDAVPGGGASEPAEETESQAPLVEELEDPYELLDEDSPLIHQKVT